MTYDGDIALSLRYAQASANKHLATSTAYPPEALPVVNNFSCIQSFGVLYVHSLCGQLFNGDGVVIQSFGVLYVHSLCGQLFNGDGVVIQSFGVLYVHSLCGHLFNGNGVVMIFSMFLRTHRLRIMHANEAQRNIITKGFDNI
ncbi:hypothetical protein KP509_38G067200 [Ceratopteris richardii]|uniref:Uncharacterized protein n=1 Tax=Ceratopteris richardii TaxID=49495 RepID=A0A8T2Q6N6_CERRI|nr:hypothetical protein KP509_38G067200 [Ceratopteris richardii]